MATFECHDCQREPVSQTPESIRARQGHGDSKVYHLVYGHEPEWIGDLSQDHIACSVATWANTPSALICAGLRGAQVSLEGTLGLEKDSRFRGAQGQLWTPRTDEQGEQRFSVDAFTPAPFFSFSHRLFKPFFLLWKPLPKALAPV